MYIVIKFCGHVNMALSLGRSHILQWLDRHQNDYTNQVELFSACCLEPEVKKTFASTC